MPAYMNNETRNSSWILAPAVIAAGLAYFLVVESVLLGDGAVAEDASRPQFVSLGHGGYN